MLTITFTVQDLARTRLALSPLWEVVASIRLLKTPRAQQFHAGWARTTTERIAREGIELGLLFDLIDPAVWYLADFLTPRPQTPLPDLTADLGALNRVSADQVRADLDVLAYARSHPVGSLDEAMLPRRLTPATVDDLPSKAIADLYADPEAGLALLVEQVEAYWELAIAPHWGRIRSLLEGDLLYRGRRLGQAGPAGLFEDLAESVKWRNGSLFIKHRRFKGVRNLNGEGLLMTPSAFVWPTVYSSTIPPWQPTFTYPARGIATLWDDSSHPAPAGLAGVLGRSRAELLAQLDAPRSTTELAARTGLTPGGVSQHLGSLRAGGLVTAHRMGRTVLYARTSVAEALLDAAAK
ncbi:winged helix-turn-helix domain-containing protein [Kribbella monticola]|uniref:winged helix-turn-helix domain-containing protein n=1 Tax=Kribbella monticola TaxID=2185285 RepID=UPI000DD4A61E|nr:winged helix-turn-helix domain-containing protein [Kribbella monticola]